MKRVSVMLTAGEASGDQLAAELVPALRERLTDALARPTDEAQPRCASLAPRFFGAGGPRMAAAGVELALDLTRHSVIGLWEVVKNYGKFRRFFRQLLRLAVERQPDVIIGVDYSGFNRRFAAAVKRHVRARQNWFHNWNPKLVQYVSPQVWASRAERADQLARDVDLLLSIFPFEQAWYAQRTPKLHVEFVGHPIFDRYPLGRESSVESRGRTTPLASLARDTRPSTLDPPQVLLLPGSRLGELRRHLPVMLGAVKLMQAKVSRLQARMVLPSAELLLQATKLGLPPAVEASVGALPESLGTAHVALASTGTVTVECAYFGVPTVAIYKTSWSTYQIGRRIVRVKFLAMPNLLADAEVFPEFIQAAATPENVAGAALELLTNESRRIAIKTQLARVIASLGGPGASQRAAEAITKLLLAAESV